MLNYYPDWEIRKRNGLPMLCCREDDPCKKHYVPRTCENCQGYADKSHFWTGAFGRRYYTCIKREKSMEAEKFYFVVQNVSFIVPGGYGKPLHPKANLMQNAALRGYAFATLDDAEKAAAAVQVNASYKTSVLEMLCTYGPSTPPTKRFDY